MSPIKKTMVALGVALMIAAGGSSVASPPEQLTPLVIAREADAVGRALRLWKKRPFPVIQLPATGTDVVASRPYRPA